MTLEATEMDTKLPTRRLSESTLETIRALKPGDKLRITQQVRVGAKRWQAIADGTFRGVTYLSTGITTDRIPEDDIIVPLIQFTKTNGELASVSLDENTQLERLPA
jgi:hypothetical protein